MTIDWPKAPRGTASGLVRGDRFRRVNQPPRVADAAWEAATTKALETRHPDLLERMLEGLPLTGDVEGNVIAPVAQVDDPRFGRSEGVPFVLEIDVDAVDHPPANVGAKVDSVFFKDDPALLFNVCFSCGKPEGLLRTGVYGDPRSRWFNVFFGYYQLDVRVKDRPDSPFGYDANGAVNTDEILRIGKSDWNYFSNWLYGVPEAHILPNNELGLATVDVAPQRADIGGKKWDVLTIDDARMVSAYVSGLPGDAELEGRGPYSFLWQCAFGFPTRLKLDGLKSFFPTEMKARLYMCARQLEHDPYTNEAVWQTFLFGGTVNKWWERQAYGRAQENAAFLEAQLAAVRKVIVSSYRDLGFP